MQYLRGDRKKNCNRLAVLSITSSIL